MLIIVLSIALVVAIVGLILLNLRLSCARDEDLTRAAASAAVTETLHRIAQ